MTKDLLKIAANNTSVATFAVAVFLSALSHVPPAQAGCSDSAQPGVDWTDCRKRSLILSGSDLADAVFTAADMSSSDLRDTRLDGVNFNKTNLVRASLQGASAIGADFSNVIASRTDFSNANFSKTNFSKAETSRANFEGSVLTDSDFSRGEFARANFTGASISGVSFDFSNLARADFRNVSFEKIPSFSNAFLFQTNFSGVDLSNASELKPWQIEMACGDDKTKLPEGLTKPDTWPCKDSE